MIPLKKNTAVANLWTCRACIVISFRHRQCLQGFGVKKDQSVQGCMQIGPLSQLQPPQKDLKSPTFEALQRVGEKEKLSRVLALSSKHFTLLEASILLGYKNSSCIFKALMWTILRQVYSHVNQHLILNKYLAFI